MVSYSPELRKHNNKYKYHHIKYYLYKFKFIGLVHSFSLFGPIELHKLQTKYRKLNLSNIWIIP